jgi:hypothetical protein
MGNEDKKTEKGHAHREGLEERSEERGRSGHGRRSGGREGGRLAKHLLDALKLKLWTIEIEKTTLLEQSRAYSSYYSSRAKPRI